MYQILHLPLNNIIQNEVVFDHSVNGIHGIVRGNVDLVSDPQFGKVVHMNGTDGFIELPPAHSILTHRSFTMCAWVNLVDTGGTLQPLLGTESGGKNEWLCLGFGNRFPYMSFYENESKHSQRLNPNQWYFITMVYNIEERTQLISVDGEAFEVSYNHAPFSGAGRVTIGKLGTNYHFNGKIAGFRLFEGVLDQIAIQSIFQEDISNRQIPDFRAVHPFDFDLLDKDAQNVLYIEDAADQHLTLQITNSATQQIRFKALSDPAGQDSFHFALTFRPGTLAANSLTGTGQIQLTTESAKEWEMALPAKESNGMDIIYLRHTVQYPFIEPGKSIPLTFKNVGADARGGARGTRVELKSHNLYYAGSETLIVSQREIHLGIVNHRGKKNIPLHVGFVGDNGVLNNGSENSLRLRISNLHPYLPLHPDASKLSFPATGPEEDPKLIVSFDAGSESEEWALSTPESINGIEIVSTKWSVNKRNEGISPEWVLTPTSELILPGQEAPATLGENYFDLSITKLVANQLAGHTHLYLRYENIPGYWDGQLKVVIEKRPLIYEGENSGISTTPISDARLAVEGLGVSKGVLDSSDGPGIAIKATSIGNIAIHAKNTRTTEGVGGAIVAENSNDFSTIWAENEGDGASIGAHSKGSVSTVWAVNKGTGSSIVAESVGQTPTIKSIKEGNGNAVQAKTTGWGPTILAETTGHGAVIVAKSYGNGTTVVANNSNNYSTIWSKNTGNGPSIGAMSEGQSPTIWTENRGLGSTIVARSKGNQPTILAQSNGTGSAVVASSSKISSVVKATNYSNGYAIEASTTQAYTAIHVNNAQGNHAIHATTKNAYDPTIYAKNDLGGGNLGSGNADYAEYFESLSGKTIPNGTPVVLESGKVRPAKKGESPIGIISVSPIIIGNLPDEWSQKYLTDKFGRIKTKKVKRKQMVPKIETVTKERQKVTSQTITEEVNEVEIVQNSKGQYVQQNTTKKVKKKIEELVFKEVDLFNPEGEKIGTHQLPVMETYKEAQAVVDKEGNPVMEAKGETETIVEPVLNPKYDPKRAYKSRATRPEWVCVGLLGQLPLRKGKPTAASWVKIKDISDKAELWLVK